MLKINQLCKSFSGFKAIENVSLNVARGEAHAVIGPNGAGKTTLFNLITGLVRPNSGAIEFGGESIVGMPAHRIARKGLARSFQRVTVYQKMTVFENVQIALISHHRQLWNLVRPAARLYADEVSAMLELVGIAEDCNATAGLLSYGKQKQLELGVALASSPGMLLLDEPTAGMSPTETRAAVALVQKIARERDLTLLFTEHDMDVVFGLATRISVLHHGAIVVTGSPDEVRDNDDVRRIYLGEEAHAHA